MADKIYDLLTKMYTEVLGKIDGIEGKIEGIEGKIEGIEGKIKGIEGKIEGIQGEISELKRVVLRIETDHGNKLDALFDGYKQHSDRLDRIEAQVSKQEEFIIKRVK